MQLTELQKTALIALADACNWSFHAHVPIEAVTRRVASNLRGDIKKALNELRKQGYCIPHPTRGSTTYQLTKKGLDTARELVQMRQS